ncbi:MAG: TonB-dependent receptor [Bacteroidaceae bacterium]
MIKQTILTLVGSCLTTSLIAATFVGIIKDKRTGEFLVGSTILVKEMPQIGAVAGLDGSFVINGIKEPSTITLVCRYTGYESREISVKTTTVSPLLVELESKEVALGTATVRGTRRKNTETSARQIEMNSMNVMNVMSAQNIRTSPDISVAGVMQRMSGVVMEQSNTGDGQYAVLRGMDKRYNYTLVNGIKIPSPDNKNRYVPLHIFPTELLDRLEVFKSLTPDMEGDATGGAVNMMMKDAPEKLSISANAAIGYNTLFFSQHMAQAGNKITQTAPREKYSADYLASMADFSRATSQISYLHPLPDLVAGLSAGHRFFNQKLGVMFAGSLQNTNKASNSLFYTDVMGQTESTVHLTQKKERTYTEQQLQYGMHLKMDYRINRGKLEWYNAFIGNQSDQVREMTTTNLTLNYIPEKGHLLQELQTRARRTEQTIFASTLKGSHTLNESLGIDWTAAYAKAKNKRPDNTYITLENSIENYQRYVTADHAERRWEHNSDRDLSASLHATYTITTALGKQFLKAGGMVRNKQRENRYVSYAFTPDSETRPVQGVDFTQLDEIDWKVSTKQGSVNALNYDAGENVVAAYAMTKFDHPHYVLLFGIRAEHTDQKYDILYPSTTESPSGKQVYWDLLPSLSFKYVLRKQMNLRASYFRSINRPSFFEIVPYTIINEDYTEYGNKDLKRAKIDNIDLRWEWLSSPSEQLLVGLFYKQIQDPIEYAYDSKNNRQFGYGPANLGNATNYGIEMDVTKYFRNFGIKANYTYTHSTITTPKTRYRRDDSGKLLREEINQTRSLVGQAPHVANLSLLYKDTKKGWNAQIAGTFISERMAVASHYLNSDYYDGAQFTIDLSAEKKMKGGASLFLKATNLLNTKSERYIKTLHPSNAELEGQDPSSGHTLIHRNDNGITLMMGARWTL